MAFPKIFSVLLLMSIAVTSVTSTSSPSYHIITYDDINSMCSTIGDHDRCKKLLTSEFSALGKSPKALAQTAVNFASKTTYQFRDLVHSVASSTHDAKWRDIFNSCMKNYDNAVGDVDFVDRELYSDARNVAEGKLNDAYDEVKRCQKLLHESGNDHSHMKVHNHELEFALRVAKRTVDYLNKNCK